MAIVVDHDEEPLDCTIGLPRRPRYPEAETMEASSFLHERPNPNINSFSAALSCYPIVSQIAHHLDLNSLHDLSSTCRQVRANLLQYRSQLVRQTLRCSNEEAAVGIRLADRMREWRGAAGVRESTMTQRSLGGSRITSGRVGKCARDLVAGCRRCGVVVCRNCTVKPPPPKALAERHRRLCRTCLKAPLKTHTSTLAACGDGKSLDYSSFTDPAFSRDPCSCPDAVHICLSCGNALRNADTTYSRGWTWRTRYSYLGGLGTGIGEGNEGVECGRGNECFGAREVEKEIDCDAEELAELRRVFEDHEKEGGRVHWGGGYFMQEVEGIGGVVKKKVKRRVRVGQVVREYEDERKSEDFLRREKIGLNRSWCHWCLRVIPGNKDEEKLTSDGLSLQTLESSSSSLQSE